MLTDGIVAPATAYSTHSMSTAANTIRFYKYSGTASGQWSTLTKTAYIDDSGVYHPQVSRTDTYYIGGLAGYAESATSLRVQIPIPSGYSTATVTTNGTFDVGYNGTRTTLTPTAVSVLNTNPASVLVAITVSGLTTSRQYALRNGSLKITLS